MCHKLPQTHRDSMCFSFLSSLTGSCSKWATESKHNQVPQLTIHWTEGQSPPPHCWEINSEIKRVKIKFTVFSFLCSDNSSPWRPTGTISLGKVGRCARVNGHLLLPRVRMAMQPKAVRVTGHWRFCWGLCPEGSLNNHAGLDRKPGTGKEKRPSPWDQCKRPVMSRARVCCDCKAVGNLFLL